MSTKEKILAILSEKKDQTVSGEILASECDVSRAAIWKAINSLRNEGYYIEGTTNGGYIFSSNSDVLSKEIFQKEFSSNFPQFKDSYIECHKEIDSTNTHAKRLLTEAENLRDANGTLTEAGKKFHRAVIVAESQSAGRGRLGRTFYSPAKTGIYITLIYAPENGITEPAKITAFSAVAVCRAIKNLYGIQPSIKWINDIFINQKKVSGILTEGFMNFETARIESAIIGIGINIQDNPDSLPDEVKKIAGSITGISTGSSNNKESDSSTTVTRATLASHVAGEVLKILSENPESVIEEYKSLSFLLGKTIKVHPVIDNPNGVYEAKAVDIDQSAALVVELSDGSKKTLSSGEVSIHSAEV